MFALMSAHAVAMTLAVREDALILSGEIERRDLDRVKATLASNDRIRYIVLRNSMGGNSWTGYRLGELFREKKLTTVVSGHCVSACSRLFLGGITRLFSDDFPPSLTYIGFHGHYDFGELNQAAVARNELVQWTLKFTDNKVDRKLVERWSRIPTRAGDIRFYPRGERGLDLHATAFCRGNERAKPHDCEEIATDALQEGIITSAARYRSPDADQLFYGRREKTYSTAQLQSLVKSPVRGSRLERELATYRRAPLPRAFAISTDGATHAWRGNSTKSAEDALAACSQQAKTTCALYSVDDRSAP
jgi:hypothetical protein